MSARCRFREDYFVNSLPVSADDPTAPEGIKSMRDDTSPADQAVLTVDFEAWLATQEGRPRKIAEQLASGLNTVEVARLHGVTRTRIWQIRERLRESWEDMFGENSTR